MPGLDGSGLLFDSFVDELQFSDVEVVAYPSDLQPDYETYVEYVCDCLPKGEVVLIAESFSAVIANLVASRSKNVIAIVFVSSFLSSPLVGIWRKLAIWGLPVLRFLPMNHFLMRRVLFNNSYNMSKFIEVMSHLPKTMIIQRLRMVLSKQKTDRIEVPYLAIHGRYDRLVRTPISDAIFINAPHGLLQCAPTKAAQLIHDWVDREILK